MAEKKKPDEMVSVPMETLRRLKPLADQMDIALPDATRFAAQVDATQPMRALARELGRLLSKRNIFTKTGALVTVDAATGREAVMTPRRFVGWVEEFCSIRHPSGASLPLELAGTVLVQDAFLESIRPLNGVHLMRLPVRRADALFKVEFLEPGYDEGSGIFTADVLQYEMDWGWERGLEWFKEHCGEYPWAWPGEPDAHVENNRSFAVHVAGCVGVYCRAMFAPGTPRPMVTYIGNQPGTGKSTLVSMALLPVFNSDATGKTPKDDDRMTAELETVAQSMRPFLFFDDIGGGIFSSPLNRFITSRATAGRIYGGNREMFEVPNATQVFATGNDIKISRDLARRSLIAELFLAGEVRGRKFRKLINGSYLAREEVRAGFLSACCSFVKQWINKGMPLHASPLESFDEWSGTVGGIVFHGAGVADPLEAPDLSAGGAQDDDEMRDLLIGLATESMQDDVFTRKELVDAARRMGLLESLVGTVTDEDIDSNTSKKFGRQLQHWRGRELRDLKGRLFRFAHKKQKSGATYPLQFLTPAGAEGTQAAGATPGGAVALEQADDGKEPVDGEA